MRHTGKVKRFFGKTGFGFIDPLPETDGQDIIVHHSEVIERFDGEYIMLHEGQRVQFDLLRTESGFRAAAVLRVS